GILRADPVFEVQARSKLQRALEGVAPSIFHNRPSSAPPTTRTTPEVAGAAMVADGGVAALRAACHLLLQAAMPDGASPAARPAAARRGGGLARGAAEQPDDPAAGGRDALLALRDADLPAAERRLTAAVLGLQSLLDAELREDGRLRLGRRSARTDPAFATLS